MLLHPGSCGAHACTPASGLKEIIPSELIENKTYAFAGHMIKAQEHNMPLLDAVLQKVFYVGIGGGNIRGSCGGQLKGTEQLPPLIVHL